MTDPIPYADYVRIEIHAGGKAEIIELVPDEWRKVKAQVTIPDRAMRDVYVGPFVSVVGEVDVTVNLTATGPAATRIVKRSDR